MPRRLILPSLLILSTSAALYTYRLEYHHDSDGSDNTTPTATIQVIGHHGTSALRSEHTLTSHQKTTDDGADIIEPDLVSTKDGMLVTRHESGISGTASVANVAAFAGHKTTKIIDGQNITDWFTEDFTFGELRTLHAHERIPNIRPDSVACNDQFDIPTLDEIVTLARDQSAKLGRNIGICPETKHLTYFQSIGLSLEDRLIDGLRRNAFTASRTTVYTQSFEVANFKAIHNKIGGSQPNWKFVQLMGTSSRQPYGFVVAKDSRILGDMMTSQGMHDITTYTGGVGPDKSSIIGLDANGKPADPIDLIRNTHNARLVVHPYTFRPENTFPPPSLHSDAGNTRNINGSITEVQAFLRADVDDFFTNDPAVGRQAVSTFKR